MKRAPDAERVYRTLIRLLEQQYNCKITYTLKPKEVEK